MNCNNCGSPLKDETHICPHCGFAVSGSAPDPVSESLFESGSSVPLNETSVGQNTLFSNEAQNTKKSTKKSGSFKTAAVIAASLIIVAGGIWAFLNFMSLFKGAKEQEAKFELTEENISEYILLEGESVYKSLYGAIISPEGYPSAASLMSPSMVSYETSFEIKMPDALADELVNLLFSSEDEYTQLIAKMVLNSGVFAQGSASLKDNFLSLNALWKLKNTDILNINSVFANDFMYAVIPELLREYYYMDVPMSNYMDDIAYLSGLDDSSYYGDVIAYLSSNEAVMNALFNDITVAALQEIEDITLNTDVPLGINGVSTTLSEIYCELTEEDVCKISLAALNTVINNGAYFDFMYGLNQIANYYTYSSAGIDPSLHDPMEIIYSLIENANDELAFWSESADAPPINCQLSLYADSGSNFAGFKYHLNHNDTETGFLFVFGTGYEMWNTDEYYETSTRIRGNLSGNPSAFSGDMWLRTEKMYSNFEAKILDFDFAVSESGTNMKTVVHVGQILKASLDLSGDGSFMQIPEFWMNCLYNLELSAVIDTTKSETNSSLELADKSNGIFITANCKLKYGETISMSVPDNAVYIMPGSISPDSALFTEILNNLKDITDKVGSLGYDIDLFSAEVISKWQADSQANSQ